MTSERIAELFNTIGKLIYVDQLGDTYAEGLKAGVTALAEQTAVASGAVDPYAELQSFIAPALNSFRPVTQALDRLGLIAQAGVDNYLRAIAPELGEDSSAAPATILTALIDAMESSGDDVAPSGTLYDYFFSTYGVQLPQDDEPTIADDIVTVTII